jgi:hypothetical protein
VCRAVVERAVSISSSGAPVARGSHKRFRWESSLAWLGHRCFYYKEQKIIIVVFVVGRVTSLLSLW